MAENLVLFNPAVGPRQDMTIEPGLTIAEIVDRALPGALSAHKERLIVALVDPRGRIEIPRAVWRQVRPLPGVQVVITLVHGEDFLGPILQAVVTIAGALIGGPLGLIFTIAGTLLINALIPPPSAPEGPKPVYQIGGWRNRIAPDQPVPYVMGRMRYAPPFAVSSYASIVDGLQYINAAFLIGYGPVKLSDYRIGETPLSEFDEVQIEVREGRAGDLPLSLMPRQVIEEVIQSELTRPLQRYDNGDVIEDAPSLSKPVSRFTATDVSEISIILFFQNGLVRFDKKGREKTLDLEIAVNIRPVGSEVWTISETLNFLERERRPFFRQFSWRVPTRGRYEIRVERMTSERTSSQEIDRVTWAVCQSIRPEYGINFDQPVAVAALRVKATYQLNGTLETFNCIASRECLDWNSATNSWVTRETRNPAALFRHALQSVANPYPASNAEIDLAAIQDWHEFCTAKGLHYDNVHDFEGSVYDTLRMIAAAGRALPRWDGTKWTVVIDRPQTLIVDHVNPRNSEQFTWSVPYFKPPHALRVQFLDETNDYQAAERVIRWPGYTGDITDTQEISIPGKTNPTEIWREVRRRMYEMIYRRESYSFVQHGISRRATRGDLVMGSWDVLSSTQFQARVVRRLGRIIELDNMIEMKGGETYAIRFRNGDTSAVREVETRPGRFSLVHLKTDAGPFPPEDEILHFGPLASESVPLLIADAEPQDGNSVLYHAVPAAPEIDELLALDVPPAWSGRVGAEIDDSGLLPAVPKFRYVLTGISGTGSANGVKVMLVAGSGGAAPTSTFQLQHRSLGASVWTTSTVKATGSISLAGYVAGGVIELRARALSLSGTPGGWTAELTVTVGAADGSTPAELPETIMISGSAGHAIITFTTGAEAPDQVQLYRATTAVLDRALHKLGSPIAVEPSTSYTRVDGDATRVNLLLNSNFGTAAAWTAGTGWTISGGEAAHVAGAAGDLSQALAGISGKYYRYGFSVERSAGSVIPRLTGAGVSISGSAVSASGRPVGRLLASAGVDAFTFAASSDFAGSIDDVVVYQETPACLPQGTLYYWLEPQNENGIPGPVSGPYAVPIM